MGNVTGNSVRKVLSVTSVFILGAAFLISGTFFIAHAETTTSTNSDSLTATVTNSANIFVNSPGEPRVLRGGVIFKFVNNSSDAVYVKNSTLGLYSNIDPNSPVSVSSYAEVFRSVHIAGATDPTPITVPRTDSAGNTISGSGQTVYKIAPNSVGYFRIRRSVNTSSLDSATYQFGLDKVTYYSSNGNVVNWGNVSSLTSSSITGSSGGTRPLTVGVLVSNSSTATTNTITVPTVTINQTLNTFNNLNTTGTNKVPESSTEPVNSTKVENLATRIAPQERPGNTYGITVTVPPTTATLKYFSQYQQKAPMLTFSVKANGADMTLRLVKLGVGNNNEFYKKIVKKVYVLDENKNVLWEDDISDVHIYPIDNNSVDNEAYIAILYTGAAKILKGQTRTFTIAFDLIYYPYDLINGKQYKVDIPINGVTASTDNSITGTNDYHGADIALYSPRYSIQTQAATIFSVYSPSNPVIIGSDVVLGVSSGISHQAKN